MLFSKQGYENIYIFPQSLYFAEMWQKFAKNPPSRKKKTHFPSSLLKTLTK
jgi:hypothetical protein